MTTTETMTELMGGSALARRYGVSPSCFANWESRHADTFPRPAVLLERKRSRQALWDVVAMDEWVRNYRSEAVAKLPKVETGQTPAHEVIGLIIQALRVDRELVTGDGECLEAVAKIIEKGGWGPVYGATLTLSNDAERGN